MYLLLVLTVFISKASIRRIDKTNVVAFKTIHIALSYHWVYTFILLSTLVPNSRDRQGKLWHPKKQKMALETILQ